MVADRMIDRYWSADTMFRNTPVKAVVATNETTPRTRRSNAFMIVSNIPVAVIAAPNSMAQIISQMVSSIPAIPRVATRSFNSGTPVFRLVFPYTTISAPRNRCEKPSRSAPAISSSKAPCVKAAVNAPISVARKRTTIEGKRIAISTPVNTGTSSNQGDIKKVCCSVSSTI